MHNHFTAPFSTTYTDNSTPFSKEKKKKFPKPNLRAGGNEIWTRRQENEYPFGVLVGYMKLRRCMGDTDRFEEI